MAAEQVINIQNQQSSEHELLTLLFLIKRLQKINSAAELEFLLVNETMQLHTYRQAALWDQSRGVVAVSGVSQTNQQSPYGDWLNGLAKDLPRTGQLRCLETDLRLMQGSGSDWQEFVPPHLLIVELPAQDDFEGGFLLINHDQPFSSTYRPLLENFAESWLDRYLQVWKASKIHAARSKWNTFFSDRKKRMWAIGGVIAACLLPMRLSVLAPAELIALNPSVVRAPMDGIIGRVYVEPNQRVKSGDKLFDFDETNLASQLSMAASELETAKAAYRQAAQQALFEEAVKSKLPILREKIAEKSTKLEWLEKLNTRAGILAQQDGIVLLNNPDELNGRAVSAGERILTIAQENSVQIEAWVAPGDLIDFEEKSTVKMYLDSSPLSPVAGELKAISLSPEQKPDGGYGYRARFLINDADPEDTRIGSKGTARMNGHYVPMIYWLLRKPLASIRGHLGI